MRSSWLYLAVRSERARLPVLICPQRQATARSAALNVPGAASAWRAAESTCSVVDVFVTSDGAETEGVRRRLGIGGDFHPYYAGDRGTDLGKTTWPPDAWKIGGGTVWAIRHHEDLATVEGIGALLRF